MTRPSLGQLLELDIDDIAAAGDGVARSEGFVVFVARGLPGQRVRARITQSKKAFARAEVVQVMQPSPHQVTPACQLFPRCGGCAFQDLAYAEQLRLKGRHVAENLRRIGGVDVVPAGVAASPRKFGHRNKMAFAFAGGAGEGLHLGLMERGSRRVVDVDDCRLMSAGAMGVVAEVRRWCRHSGHAAFDSRLTGGLWRHLVLRESTKAGEEQVDRLAVVITAPQASAKQSVAELAEHLLAGPYGVVGVVHATRAAADQLAEPEERVAVYGQDHLHFAVGRQTLRVSAESFFQPNTGSAELVYAAAVELAGVKPGQRAWDLYCGVGAMALGLAEASGSGGALVTGVEFSPQAVADARANAEAAGLVECRFEVGDVAQLLLAAPQGPDVVVVDPPRAGMSDAAVRALLTRLPQRIVSVSCHPASQARDVGRLLEAYAVREVRPVDQFPHTPHVENVVLLERFDARGARTYHILRLIPS